MRFSRRMVRKARLSTARGLRKASNWIAVGAKRSTSPSVREKLLRSSRSTRDLASLVRPPKRFLPGEVFVSLKELSQYGPESEHLFRRIKKNVFWDKHGTKMMLAGMGVSAVGGTAGSVLVLLVTRNSLAYVGGTAVGMTPGTWLLFRSLRNTGNYRQIESDLTTLREMWQKIESSRVQKLLASKKYNFLVADFQNEGFRLSEVPEKTAKAIVQLQGRWFPRVKEGERIIVLNQEGEVVYPKPNQLGETQPAPERRIGEADRRKGGDKERDRRHPKHYIVQRFKADR